MKGAEYIKMSFPVKIVVEKLLPHFSLHLRAYLRLIVDKKSYIHSTGWLMSLRERKPIDRNGNPIPWMNYPTIRFLEERLTNKLSIFEYGSGFSTLFFASRVKNVTSVEHDYEWYNLIKSRMPNNVNLLFKDSDINGNYCRAILTEGIMYDLVIIDGEDRINCTMQSLRALSSRGVVILDDSLKPMQQPCVSYLKEMGFKALLIEGLKPTRAGVDGTTIFYRDGNCLGL